jgi:hypothetical protein
LGSVEEGKRAVKNLLKLKPDFPTRSRMLIRHYINFENIVKRVVNSLREAGLNLEDD